MPIKAAEVKEQQKYPIEGAGGNAFCMTSYYYFFNKFIHDLIYLDCTEMEHLLNKSIFIADNEIFTGAFCAVSPLAMSDCQLFIYVGLIRR